MRLLTLKHDYPFDPSYGYSLEDLLTVTAPIAPPDFTDFWRQRYRKALSHHPKPMIQHTGVRHSGFEVYDLSYRSTDDRSIGGWLLVPQAGPVIRGIIVGHGYGGREGPDYQFSIPGAAFLFPCFRGLSRSRCDYISELPQYHVLHDIDKPERYIMGGCAEDLWMAVSALLVLFPAIAGNVGYMGISFGGGIGALAFPWDTRVQRIHLNVPSFGHHPLRLQLPTCGSAAAVQSFEQRHGHVLDTLQYYDASISAGYAEQPLHMAAARFDPVVAPPGQFAVYNAWAGEKTLFVLEAGHFDYANKTEQERSLLSSLQEFFDN